MGFCSDRNRSPLQQWCAGKLGLKQNKTKNSLVCSICQFLWCKHSCHGLFQAVSVTSLNTEQGREVQKPLSLTNASHPCLPLLWRDLSRGMARSDLCFKKVTLAAVLRTERGVWGSRSRSRGCLGSSCSDPGERGRSQRLVGVEAVSCRQILGIF